MKFINIKNLRYNLNVLKQASGGAKICAVVKNEAYGHGLFLVAKAIAAKVDYFAVATAEEADALAAKGIKNKIIILTPQSRLAKTLQAEYVTDSITQLKKFAKMSRHFYIHIKLDTGMHRFGFSTQAQFKQAIQFVQKSKNLHLAGICTHFSESESIANTQRQEKRFTKMLSSITLPDDILIHKSNTGGICFNRANEMIRLGIGLYGYGLSNLKPVMKVQAKVITVRKLKAGQKLGYMGAHTCTHKTKVAVLDIGYGNGFSRAFSNGAGSVLIDKTECKILGNICMNSCFVDVSQLKHVQAGQRATVLGNRLTADVLAQRLCTIAYEVLCNFK